MRDLENDRAVEASAIVGGDRAADNERKLHGALRSYAARLPPQALCNIRSDLFASFLIGGFECSTHRHQHGRRLDLIAATGHDKHAQADYRMLAEHGIRTVRDGFRWHLIESTPGHYDWSSFLPQLRAARDTGTQVIWDICHWGWPDDLDIWSPAFIDRLARFARAAAQFVRDETDAVPFYVPVNEISFWSWAGGSLAYINPLATGRGTELKAILVRAAIAAIEVLREVDPRARIVHAEPAIHVVPRSDHPQDVRAAQHYTLAQFEALDFLSGRHRPELDGRPDYVDIVGVNYYLHNQWIDGGTWIEVDHPRYGPLHHILRNIHARYGRPMFMAETGIEAHERPLWLRFLGGEVA